MQFLERQLEYIKTTSDNQAAEGMSNVPLCHSVMRRQIECPVHIYRSPCIGTAAPLQWEVPLYLWCCLLLSLQLPMFFGMVSTSDVRCD